MAKIIRCDRREASQGRMLRSCSRCGLVVNRVLRVLGHEQSWTELESAREIERMLCILCTTEMEKA